MPIKRDSEGNAIGKVELTGSIVEITRASGSISAGATSTLLTNVTCGQHKEGVS